MSKKEELIKLHKTAYMAILLKSIESRTKEELNFYLWYEGEHIENANRIKDFLKSRGLIT